MPSGNFLVGRNLGLESFNEYVLNYLSQEGLSVHDKISVGYQHDNRQVLVSISGEGDLELLLSSALVHAGHDVDAKSEELRSKGGASLGVYGHQLYDSVFVGPDSPDAEKGRYETIGVYQDPAAASQIFLPLAQKYMVINTQHELSGLAEQFSSLAKRFSAK